MINLTAPFTRRPSYEFETGHVKHFDSISVDGGNNHTRGFYICQHSSKSVLDQNNRPCTRPEGFVWPKIYLENFQVSNINGGEGIYITDGTVGTMQLDVVIQNGKILNLTNSNAIVLDHLQLASCVIDTVTMTDPIKITNSNINLLKLENLTNPNIIITNSTVKSIELYNCVNPKFQGLPDTVIPIVHAVPEIKGIKAAMAVNVMINGILYSATANNLNLKAGNP